MSEARQGGAKAKPTRINAGKSRTPAPPPPHPSFAQYQNAVHLLQEGKYEKASAIFEKLTQDGAPELLERSRTYLVVCHKQSQKIHLSFADPEELYDYAISLLNTGQYEDARDHFESLLKKNSSADYAHYGLALLDSITGQAEECLEHLSRAIALNPKNRIQARTDNDFSDMVDDPRFTELLYPEVS
jgi:tetratricopeptide (TPR) repeat protein